MWSYLQYFHVSQYVFLVRTEVPDCGFNSLQQQQKSTNTSNKNKPNMSRHTMYIVLLQCDTIRSTHLLPESKLLLILFWSSIRYPPKRRFEFKHVHVFSFKKGFQEQLQNRNVHVFWMLPVLFFWRKVKVKDEIQVVSSMLGSQCHKSRLQHPSLGGRWFVGQFVDDFLFEYVLIVFCIVIYICSCVLGCINV